MNDNNLNNNSNKVNTYRATTNLNTAIENPQININSATGVNIQNSGYNNYAEENIKKEADFLDNNYTQNNININYQNPINLNTQNINTSKINEVNTENINNANITQDIPKENLQPIQNNNYNIQTPPQNTTYNYEPVMKEKKRANDNALSNTIHSKEFKIMVFIIFILIIFLLLMPYIYDFIRNLQMGTTA